MTTYTFKDQSGKAYDVEAKQGVSESKAFEQFQAAMRAQGAQQASRPGGVSDEAARMALEGSGWGERALMNLGAGFDTTWQGAKQLFGGGPGDAELEGQRALKDVLSDSTRGGGLLQFAGETLPSLAIPAGGFVKAGQLGVRGAGMLARTLGGVERAAAGASRAATPARMGTGIAALDSALAGGVSGALQPVTSDESRAFNVGLGTVGGAVIPGLVAGGRAGVKAFTQAGAEERAAAQLIEALGGDDAARAAVAKIRGYKPGAFVEDIPMSSGEILQEPKIAGLERSARARFTAPWSDLAGAQAEGRYSALRDATRNADDLEQLILDRRAATAPLRERALAAAGKDEWFHEPVLKHIRSLMAGEAGADPAIRKLAGYVTDVLDSGVTPEKLYRVRKVLERQLQGPSLGGEEMSAAAKAVERETLGMMQAIDASLDKASGGKWSKYMSRYGQESKAVTDAKAGAAIRDVFEAEGAPTIAGLGGSVPEITGSRLGKAIGKHGQSGFGDTLDFGTRDALTQLQENIARSEDLQKLLKKTGTSGGGSNSPMDLAGLAASQMIPGGVLGQGVVGAVLGRSKSLTQAALSDALQNPDLFVRGIERKLTRGAPLTKTEELILTAVRGATGASLPAAFAP